MVVALPEEMSVLRRRVVAPRRVKAGSLRCISGTIAGCPVILGITGAGTNNAERAATTIVQHFEVDGLVGFGVAGGLSPGVELGSILAAYEILESAEPAIVAAPPPDPSWLHAALALDGVRQGTLVSVHRVITRTRDKADLWRQLPRDREAVVDTESCGWARAAASHEIPYLIVRAVSDSATEHLPFFLEACSDQEGAIRRSSVLYFALTRPWTITRLLELRARVKLCCERLADALVSLLGRGLP